MVLRRREAAAPVAVPTDAPAELFEPDDLVWYSAATTLRWFELHGVEPRRSARVEDMGPRQRFKIASTEWAVSKGHPAAYDLEKKEFPAAAFLHAIGVPVVDDMTERLARIGYKY